MVLALALALIMPKANVPKASGEAAMAITGSDVEIRLIMPFIVSPSSASVSLFSDLLQSKANPKIAPTR